MITTAITPQLIVHTASDETGLVQVTAAMQFWYGHPDFDPDRPVLWDMRAATDTLPDEDVEAWSESNSSQINERRPGCKTAWVFPNSTAAEFAVDVLGAHDWRHKVRIFNNDIEAARAWLLSTIR